MKKLMLIAAILTGAVSISTQAYAMYAQCTVQKTLDALNRPGGGSFFVLEKGSSVTVEDQYRDWVFIHIERTEPAQWGWIRRNTLTCDQEKAAGGRWMREHPEPPANEGEVKETIKRLRRLPPGALEEMRRHGSEGD
jgi:hypothetical protein